MPIDKNELTKEQIAKAMACETAEELMALAKSEGFELTKEEAEAYLVEMSDIELDEAALKQFKRIAQADRLALKSLQDKKIDPRLKALRREIHKHGPKAILSEKAVLKFIDDTMDLLGAWGE